MSLYKHQLTLPTEDTRQRIIEIQFFLFMKTFIYKYGEDNRYVYDLINTLSEIYDTRAQAIRIAMESLRSPAYKPTYMEVCIAAFWLGIPVRKIAKINEMSPRTYYYKLEEYKNKDEPDLEPRLEQGIRRDIFKFIQNASIMFTDTNIALQGVNFYEQQLQ